MLQTDIMALVAELEATLPVEAWQSHGFHVWPLLRMYLAFELVDFSTAPAPASRLALLRRLAGGQLAAWQDPRHQARPDAPCDLLFLSDGVSFERVGGLWQDRLCDPLMDAVQARGLGTSLLTPQAAYLVPRRTPSVFIQPQLDALRLVALARQAPVALPLDALLVRLRAHFGPRFDGLPGVLRRRVGLVRAACDYFKARLQRSGARLGCVVDYYSPYGMAFCLACRELGLVAVDLQHGLAGHSHVAYGQWHKQPPGGYGLLPGAFWSWTLADAEAVREWGAVGLAGGNPTLLAAPDPGVEAELQALDGAPRLLYTLQGIETEQELGRLSDAIAARPGWRWWLRCHPLRLEQGARLAALLAARGLTNAELERATALPLPALLRHARVHVTGFSAAVLEAEAMGVPSVVTHPDARELLGPQLARGSATYAATAPAMVSAIEACLAAGIGPAAGARGDPAALEGLLSLLAPSSLQAPRYGL